MSGIVQANRNLASAVRSLGDVMQLGFVPKDWQSALDFWVKLGVGPFFVTQRVQASEIRYRGSRTEIDFTVALAYWGDLQIELIRQNDGAPSIYREWYESGRDGLHHVCLHVDDVRAARAACEKTGGVVVQDLDVPGGGAIYVDFGAAQPLVEFIQLPVAVAERYEAMREAARIWDGSDPVRIRTA